MKLSPTVPMTGYYRKSAFLTGLLIILLFCNCAFAQTDAVNVSSAGYKAKAPGKSDDCATCTCICIQGSIDFAKVHESYAGVPGGFSAPGYKTKVGFNAGVFATHPFLQLGPGYVAGRAGLEFIQKGTKISDDQDKETIALNYIELPIDVLYQYQIQDIGKAFLGLGPYFAYGIGGKDKYNNGTTSGSGGSFSEDNGAKRFDFGLQFIGGFQLSCMASISLSYDLGLIDIAKNGTTGNNGYTYHDKNGVFSINLSYCLGGLLGSK
jgi:hypothetical protein